jgi:ADP-heptose:LPS heptosyltransferase
MRIAVLSLLRMGDCLQHFILLENLLKQKNISAKQVTWIIDESSSPVEKILPVNHTVICFPRKRLQEILVSKQSSPLRAAQLLEDWRKHFLASYDLVLNLSHTKLSFKVATLIRANQKLGFDLSNPWLNYLNLIAQTPQQPMLPYFQLQALSLGIDVQLKAPRWPRQLHRVTAHCLASDIQKNWSFTNWAVLFQTLTQKNPQLEITLIGAPSEEKVLRGLFQNPQLQFLCADLARTRSHLQETDLLIGVDSAMLHLAALDNVPSLGIFLGPAQAEKITPISMSCEVLSDRHIQDLNSSAVVNFIEQKTQNPKTSKHNLKRIGPVFTVLDEVQLRQSENWSLLRDKLEYNKVNPNGVEFL